MNSDYRKGAESAKDAKSFVRAQWISLYLLCVLCAFAVNEVSP